MGQHYLHAERATQPTGADYRSRADRYAVGVNRRAVCATDVNADRDTASDGEAMNDRIVTITMRKAFSPKPPKTAPDARVVAAVTLLIIGLVMAAVMWNANMSIRSYRREALPVQAVR